MEKYIGFRKWLEEMTGTNSVAIVPNRWGGIVRRMDEPKEVRRHMKKKKYLTRKR